MNEMGDTTIFQKSLFENGGFSPGEIHDSWEFQWANQGITFGTGSDKP